MFDWANVIDSFVGGGVAVGAFIGALKKWPWILKGATFIVNHAPEIAKTVEAIAGSPAGAIAKEALHHEIDKVTAQFQKSEIGRLALVGLHSFNTHLADLSDTQKIALIHFVKLNVPGATVSDSQIREVLDDMQRAAEEFAQLDVVKYANLFTTAAKDNVNTMAVSTAMAGANVNAQG